ncbi:hypothetical protein [Parasitella parasitica]|uniref:Sestrin n=1 Tax=Parasitella parasitica TaxID=35722 RepID=A0A0B7MYH9_9FUNG|nr:hypothetical protein [Parasitella parasitica]
MSQSWNQIDEQQAAETIRDSRASQLQSCRQRIALFKGLQVDNYEERVLALEKIIQVVRSFVRSSLSPSSNTTSPSLSDSPVHNLHLYDQDDEEYSEQLLYYLLTILRLAYTCPYSDVRQTFQEALTALKETAGVVIPKPRYKSPSHFIPLYDIFSLESNISSSSNHVIYPRSSNLSFSPWSINSCENDQHTSRHTPQNNSSDANIPKLMQDYTGGRPSDEYVRQMMIKTFTDEGRLANLFRILSFFPTFYEVFHVTFTKLLKGSVGPLSRTWKSYIGLMVASEQQCQYLVSVMKIDFLYNGGDPNWLIGLDYVPNKLHNVSSLILKLARQPWRLNSDDIGHLLAGGGFGDAWSKGELVQVTLIIGTFLGLSSFIMGCGIVPEIDMTGGFVIPAQQQVCGGIETELDLPTIHFDNECQQLLKQRRFQTDHGVGLGLSTAGKDLADTERTTKELIHRLKAKKNCAIKEQILESFEKMNIAKDRPPKMTVNTNLSPETLDKEDDAINVIFEDLQRFVEPSLNDSIQLETFNSDTDEYFMLGDYCWEDHGCDLANHYLPGIGDDLVTEFQEAQTITDWSIFHPVAEDVVDTTPLRNAIWYYTQKIMGVTKEDYTYADIPTYLNDRTTQYIQDLCMSPFKIQKSDWINIGIVLRPEEKCHVNLLVASARKQAVLCQGLSLISEL